MRIKLDNGAIMPTRAHDTDAGIDMYAMEDKVIMPHSMAVFNTGVHVQLPNGCVGMVKSKSGLYFNDDIISTGTIDEGYTGTVMVKLTNLGGQTKVIRRGDKISQLVIVPVLYESIEVVDEITGGPRGDGGFGSTGNSVD